MKKTDIEYFEKRIELAVKCTNGEISTRLNKYKLTTTLSDAEKFELIKQGKAVVKELDYLVRSNIYKESRYDALLDCFVYPSKTKKQIEAERYNDTIKNKEQDLHTEVQLEGKRLLDRMVLGTVTPEQVPDELKLLGEMVKLAVM